MSQPKKATLLIFGYDDGSSEYAIGDHATEVMQWLHGAQTMMALHGGIYTGRKMIEGMPRLTWGPEQDIRVVNISAPRDPQHDLGDELEEGCFMMGGGTEDGMCPIASNCPGCAQVRRRRKVNIQVPE